MNQVIYLSNWLTQNCMFKWMHTPSQFGVLSIYAPWSTIWFTEHMEYPVISSSCLGHICMCVSVSMGMLVGVYTCYCVGMLVTNNIESEEGRWRNIFSGLSKSKWNCCLVFSFMLVMKMVEVRTECWLFRSWGWEQKEPSRPAHSCC